MEGGSFSLRNTGYLQGSFEQSYRENAIHFSGWIREQTGFSKGGVAKSRGRKTPSRDSDGKAAYDDFPSLVHPPEQSLLLPPRSGVWLLPDRVIIIIIIRFSTTRSFSFELGMYGVTP